MLRHQVVQRAERARGVAVHVQDAGVAGLLQIGQFGEVDRALGGARLQEAHQLFGDFAADVLLRFLGAAADVRGEDDVGHADQRAGQRFVRTLGFGGEHVQRGAGQVAGFQGGVQRVDVHHRAARGVDQNGAAAHAPDGCGVHDLFGGLAARHVQGHDVGLLQQIVQRPGGAGVAQRQLGLDVVVDHAHAQAFGQRADLRADIAVAHDAQRLAAGFEGARGALVPVAEVHARVLFRNPAQQQDGFAQHQFGDRAGVREGRIEYRDAALHGRVQVDLVGADAEAAHDAQVGVAGQQAGVQVRARTDPGHLRAAQGFAQLCRRQGRGVRDDVGVAGGFEDGAGARMDVLEQDDLCHDCQGRGGECVLFIVAHFCCGARSSHWGGGGELFQR
ncbi:hypothetical protein D9M72_219820 [compost metagenome]